MPCLLALSLHAHVRPCSSFLCPLPPAVNVTCERNGVALAGAEVMWTRNGGEINVTDGHRISGNMLAFRIHHTHMLRQVIKCSAVGSDNNTYAASVGFVSSGTYCYNSN